MEAYMALFPVATPTGTKTSNKVIHVDLYFTINMVVTIIKQQYFVCTVHCRFSVLRSLFRRTCSLYGMGRLSVCRLSVCNVVAPYPTGL